MVTGERQAARIRSLYLKTILRQDIGFFDDAINTGEVIGRLSGDTILIQDAIGEKAMLMICHHCYLLQLLLFASIDGNEKLILFV